MHSGQLTTGHAPVSCLLPSPTHSRSGRETRCRFGPGSTSIRYPHRTQEDAARTVSSPADARRGRLSGVFIGRKPDAILTHWAPIRERTMQPLADIPEPVAVGEVLDNDTLCRADHAQEPVTAYSSTGRTNCRLVVDRDGRRTNTAAHLLISGASANDLAVLAAHGVAGTVSVAVAGKNLHALIDALLELDGRRP